MSVRRIKEVTQITSKTTSVTANGYDGIVTTVALTDAAGSSFDFTINNEKVKSKSTILLTTEYAGTTGTPTARVVSYTKGSFIVRLSNVGSTALNALAKLHFKVTHE